MNIEVDIEVDRKSNEPLYKQIRRGIIERIKNGKWSPHDQLPNYKKLSEDVGVSMITIKQSVGALVNEGLLYRKRGVGVFIASQEVLPKTGIIGLMVPDVRHPFFAKLAHAIQYYAAGQQYTMFIVSLCGISQDVAHTVEHLPYHTLDGIITSREIVERFPVWFANIISERKPLVFVDGSSPDNTHDYVETDNYRGIELVVDHLCELGHKRLGFALGHVAGHILTSGAQERVEHFKSILRGRGLPFEPPQIQISSSQNNESAGEEAGYMFLSLRTPPTAILCMNDYVAKGVITVARKLHVRCPENLSVVGFDDIDIAEHLSPSLTTIRQPVAEIAKTVVDIMLQRIENPAENGEKPSAIRIPPQLIVRASTAPPPAA